MTLTFVPKLLAMLFVMTLAFPFMLQTLVDFSDDLFARIATME
jgi:flagellar biosynthesis protein FliQ